MVRKLLEMQLTSREVIIQILRACISYTESSKRVLWIQTCAFSSDKSYLYLSKIELAVEQVPLLSILVNDSVYYQPRNVIVKTVHCAGGLLLCKHFLWPDEPFFSGIHHLIVFLSMRILLRFICF